MNGMSMSNYVKIKKGLENGDSVNLDGHFFNVFDLVILKKKLKECFCCDDLRLEVENYKKIKIKSGLVRFSGSVISFCPFCGKEIGVLR